MIQSKYLIAYVKQDQNLFMLGLTVPNRAMQVIKLEQLTHLVNKNKKIKIRYYKFSYSSNAKII